MWPNDRVFFFFWVGSILNIYEYCQSMKKTRWHAEVKWGVIWVKLSPCMSWGKLNCFSCLFHAVETGISAGNDRVFFFFWVGSILNIYEYCQSMKKTRWHAEVKWGVIWVKLSPCMSWGKLNCFSCLFHAVETGISAGNFW